MTWTEFTDRVSRRSEPSTLAVRYWCVEPLETQRLALLAGKWDAQVTVVDIKGCGCRSDRLARTERRALRRGDCTLLAGRMVRTAQASHPPLRPRPVTIVGYSMGRVWRPPWPPMLACCAPRG